MYVYIYELKFFKKLAYPSINMRQRSGRSTFEARSRAQPYTDSRCDTFSSLRGYREPAE